MDNASKALIMAGAILISIAIVGVGVFIFSSTSSITNSGQQQLDASAAQMANSTLRQYAGDRQRGSTVNEFVEYVRVLNTNDTFPVDLTFVTTMDGTSGGMNIPASGDPGVVANSYYTVKLKDNDSDGYYDQIWVKKN